MWKSIVTTLLLVLPLAGCRTQPDSGKPFAFGVMSDIQYADKDISGPRHYRTALERLQACVDELNQHDLAFTIQIGDIIDGYESEEHSLADLDAALGIYNQLNMPKYHVIGNHCLNAGEEQLKQRLNLARFYYDFTLPEAKDWRFIVLSGTDAGGGILGEEQLAWLEETLEKAGAAGQKVIVFNHYALLKAAAPNVRMEEPEPVLKLLEDAGCVVAYFAGHDHAGGYAYQNGIHHITMRGMIEAPEQNAFAIIEVGPEGLKETGFGKEPGRDLPFVMGQ